MSYFKLLLIYDNHDYKSYNILSMINHDIQLFIIYIFAMNKTSYQS